MSEHMETHNETSEWLAVSLRMAAFPSKPITEPNKQNWWFELAGQEPESRNFKPRAMEHIEQGIVQLNSSEKLSPENPAIQLSLFVNPVVVQWQILATVNSESPILGIPSIGSFGDKLPGFISLMNKWLSNISFSVQRLGFGADLVLPAPSLEVAYQNLYRLTNIDVTSGVFDFLYQINRPRDAVIDIPDLRINRLSKWNALRAASGIEVGVGEQSIPLPGLESFYSHVELDINTSPDFTDVIERRKLVPTFIELSELGRQIAEQGDIV